MAAAALAHVSRHVAGDCWLNRDGDKPKATGEGSGRSDHRAKVRADSQASTAAGSSRFPASKESALKTHPHRGDFVPCRWRSKKFPVSPDLSGHFGASGLPGQYFDLVEIQSMASASVAKSPIWESGPFPVFTATNQRPSPLIISAWN
jgi:hypothetical protein